MARPIDEPNPEREVARRLADPLADCRERGDGVGFVGPDIPVEVLIASGRPFGHLPWRTDGATPWADRWLESSFPFWARSILEQWHEGDFDALATVVFTRADDASQRLYYYIAELRRRGMLGGPEPRLFDIALIHRATSLAHTEAAIGELMLGLDVAAGALPAAFAEANRLRRHFGRIEAARAGNGPFYEALARAALWTDPGPWLPDLGVPTAPVAAARVLLAGSMPPDARLHEAVENGGASIVAEAHALDQNRLGPEFDPDAGQPVRTLASQLRAASFSPRAFVDRAARVVERVRLARADAALIWLTREDEALAWSSGRSHVPACRC